MATLINQVKFIINFDIENNVLSFTDNSDSESSTVTGVCKITYLTDGTILFQSADWGLTPANWNAPDINGETSTWAIEDIPLPAGSPNGDYKVEYVLYDSDGDDTLEVSRTFNLDYTAPTVSIEMTALCSTSQLVSEDTTDYMITMGGVDITPTITRVHTITKPAGSSANAPGSTSAASRTIGGGGTDATRLWTRTWQTNIVTGLVYNIASWGTDTCDLYVTDTVKGDDQVFVQCDATVCALATCYYNMLDRWNASLLTNFGYKEEYRDKIIQAEGLFTKLFLKERCGLSIESTVLELQTLLEGEDCNCTIANDSVSVPVVPWASIVGGGSGTASTFKFWVNSSAPTSLDGTDSDMWLHSTTGVADLYQKVNGAWVFVGSILGAAGTPGSADAKIKVLVSTSLEYPTGGNLSPINVSYPFEVLNNGLFDYSDDYILFTWELLLAHNDNGKTIAIEYGGSNVFTWFTDEEITADTDVVVVKLKVTRVTNILQHLTAWLVQSGTPGVIVGPSITRDYNLDISTDKTVQLVGTNSVASVGDIIGYSTIVKLYKHETDIIPGGGGSTDSRGPVSQMFVATEGQTTFDVTDFTANSYYMPFIDYNLQSQSVVTRVGQRFTYAPGLSAGQVLLIVN